MDKIISLNRELKEFGRVLLQVMNRMGFKCQMDGEEKTIIFIESEPAGIDTREFYRRLNRILVGVEYVIEDIASSRTSNDNDIEYKQLLTEDSLNNIKQHAQDHKKGIPSVCVHAVQSKAKLPESLVLEIFEFIAGEMKIFSHGLMFETYMFLS